MESQRVRHSWAINTTFLGDMLNSQQEGLCKLKPTHSFWLLLFVNKVYGDTATPTSLHIPEGALPLQRQWWVFGTKTIRPKTLITWSFQEKVGDSWAREKLVKHWSWSALEVKLRGENLTPPNSGRCSPVLIGSMQNEREIWQEGSGVGKRFAGPERLLDD